MTVIFDVNGAAVAYNTVASGETDYVSGPMTAIAEFNFPTFDSVRDGLCALGDTVYSPADHDRQKINELWPGKRPEDFGGYAEGNLAGYFNAVSDGGAFTLDNMLRWDFNVIANDITRIVMLPGWEKSTGARHERLIAEALSIPVWLATLDGWALDGTLRRAWSLKLDEHQTTLTELLKLETEPYISNRERFFGEPESEYVQASGKVRISEEARQLAAAFHDKLAEVRITDPITGGQKGSKDVQLGCAPPEGLRELGRVFAMGAAKYERHNFRKGYAWSLSSDALLRHVIEWLDGNDRDDESGLNHLAHAAWHCLNLIQYTKDHPELDDRW